MLDVMDTAGVGWKIWVWVGVMMGEGEELVVRFGRVEGNYLLIQYCRKWVTEHDVAVWCPVLSVPGVQAWQA